MGPRIVPFLFVRNLYHLVNYFENFEHDTKLEPFQKMVPDYQDAKAWFAAKGQWANGEKFGAGADVVKARNDTNGLNLPALILSLIALVPVVVVVAVTVENNLVMDYITYSH